MIVTNDEELYHILLSLRAHGWTRNLPKKNSITSIKSSDKFKETFNFVLPGYNLRPTEINELRGDAKKARRELKWKPKTSFKSMVKEMVLEDIKRQSIFPV